MEEIIKVLCNSESPSTPRINIGGKSSHRRGKGTFYRSAFPILNGGVKRGCAQEVCCFTLIISSIYRKGVAVLHTNRCPRAHRHTAIVGEMLQQSVCSGRTVVAWWSHSGRTLVAVKNEDFHEATKR